MSTPCSAPGTVSWPPGRRTIWPGWASSPALLLFRENLPVLAAAAVFLFPVFPALRKRLSPLRGAGAVFLSLLTSALLLLLLLLCICALVKGSYNPFIYFNF